MKTLILICALGLSRPDCSIETATVVVKGPEATNLAQCGFVGQAYFADTALAGYVEDGHYLKILCTSGDRPGNPPAEHVLLESRPIHDHHPSD
ncbi:MAG: hypothetical protein ACR2QH_09730 [Geminicoccaceae bacterium]